jgi:hypothetical protein
MELRPNENQLFPGVSFYVGWWRQWQFGHARHITGGAPGAMRMNPASEFHVLVTEKDDITRLFYIGCSPDQQDFEASSNGTTHLLVPGQYVETKPVRGADGKTVTGPLTKVVVGAAMDRNALATLRDAKKAVQNLGKVWSLRLP